MNIILLDTIGVVIICTIVSVVILLAIGITVWWILTTKRIHRLQVKCDQSLIDIDKALVKRFELVTKQVLAIKGQIKGEDKVLKLVKDIMEKLNLSERPISVLREINSLMNEVSEVTKHTLEEKHELKADDEIKKLQSVIFEAEENLNSSRRAYNANISAYNHLITVFPSNIIAKHLKVQKRLFFPAEEKK